MCSTTRRSICISNFTGTRTRRETCSSSARNSAPLRQEMRATGGCRSSPTAIRKSWPRTIDEVAKADFKYVLGGHGPLQSDRTVMMNQRNYIEELAGRVEQAKQAGQSLAEMQKRITVASLRSLQSNGYEAFLARTSAAGHPHYGATRPIAGRRKHKHQRCLQEHRSGFRQRADSLQKPHTGTIEG